MAAVLANGGGYYSAFAYVSECRRMGIAVLPPDVDVSGRSWTGRSAPPADPAADGVAAGGVAAATGVVAVAGDGAPQARDGAAGTRGWVRAGLAAIRGLRAAAIDAILGARAGGPFCSLDDLLRRTGIDAADARRLIRAGACDALAAAAYAPSAGAAAGAGAARGAAGWAAAGAPPRGPEGRPLLHWRLRDWETRAAATRRGRAPALFDPDPAPLPRLPPRPPDAGALLRDEEEALGFLISRHPLTRYRDALLAVRRAGIRLVRGAEMGRHVGRRVAMIGWLITAKLVTTKDDEPMEFVSFEDTTAIYETTFFPRVYERFCRMLTTARPYLLRGRVEEEFGSVTLTVDSAEFLDRAAGLSRGGAAAPAAAAAAARPGPDRRPAGGRCGPPRGRPARPA